MYKILKNKYIFRIGWLLYFLLLQVSHLQAQFIEPEITAFDGPSKYKMRIWTTEEGLPSNYTTHLRESEDGYLWIGSHHGLIRFDGSNFITFTSSNTPGWNEGEKIENICHDRTGQLWFAANNAGKINIYTLDVINQKGYAQRQLGREIIFMRCLEDNAIAVNHVDEFSIIRAVGDYETFSAPGLNFHVPFNVIVRNDTTLYTLRNELHYIINDQHTSYKVPLPEDSSEEASWPPPIEQVAVEHDLNNILLFINNTVIRFSNGHFSEIAEFNDVTYVYPGYAFEAGSRIWVNTKDNIHEFSAHGITEHAYIQGNDTFIRFFRYFEHEETAYALWTHALTEVKLLKRLPNNAWEAIRLEDFGVKNVNRILVGKEGRTWLTTDVGLIEVTPRKINMITLKEGLRERFVYAIHQDKSGAIWAGLFGGGVQKLEDNTWINYTEEQGLTHNHITTLYEDVDGGIFAGTLKGVSLIRGNEVKTILDYEQLGIPHQFTREIHRDFSGNLLVTTNVLLRSTEDNQFIPYQNLSGIRVIKEFKKDTLLVGFQGGIYEYGKDVVNGKIWPYFTDKVILSFMKDPDSTLWVATHGHGLIRKKGEHHFAYTRDHGLPDNVAHYTIDDQLGSIWIGTDKGLIRMPRSSADSVYLGLADQLNITIFGTEDGLESAEFIGGPNSAFRAQDGKLWFATVRGIAIVDPLNIEFNEVIPEMQIMSLEFQGQPVDLEDVSPLKSGPQNTIEVQFRTISLITSKRRQYRHRLSGFDDEWQTGPLTSVRYTNLDPGYYTFEVHGTNNDGRWSQEPATTSFRILPPFYASWWFILLCITLGLFVLWLAYRQIMLKNELAVAQVVFDQELSMAQTRIQLADDLHDDIGSQLMGISQSLDFLTSKEALNIEEMNELNRQSNIAHALRLKLRDHVWLVDSSSDSLSDLIVRMEWFMSTITGPSMCTFKGPDSMTNRMVRPTWRRNVYLLYKEALQNAIKHAEATQIDVIVMVHDDDFSFLVKDNGRGMALASAPTGRGMQTMQRRANQENGILAIESTQDGGTTIQFNVKIV